MAHPIKAVENDALNGDMRSEMAALKREFFNKLKKSNTTAMSKICQITGKRAMTGNNVSHSKRRTKRKFEVNLFTKKFYWVEQDMWILLTVSANGLRTINKMGLDNALKEAEKKGYIDYKDIKVLSF